MIFSTEAWVMPYCLISSKPASSILTRRSSRSVMLKILGDIVPLLCDCYFIFGRKTRIADMDAVVNRIKNIFLKMVFIL